MKHNEVTIELASGLAVKGFLTIPKGATGIVIFAHGSGSGRLSSRNQFVALQLVNKGLATLLMDLLTADEEAIDEGSREYRFNIPFLTQRLREVTQWVRNNKPTSSLNIGYFGASTGAAAALAAAAQEGESIRAVVSRGGRPDLALSFLSHVRAATLFIVGGYDTEVISLNQMAFENLSCTKAMKIVPRATHLFEESGALEKVAVLASRWFLSHLS